MAKIIDNLIKAIKMIEDGNIPEYNGILLELYYHEDNIVRINEFDYAWRLQPEELRDEDDDYDLEESE